MKPFTLVLVIAVFTLAGCSKPPTPEQVERELSRYSASDNLPHSCSFTYSGRRLFIEKEEDSIPLHWSKGLPRKQSSLQNAE